ncbi:MAG: NAD-dependent epimerase/dehydratase family protein [Candidatus Dormibacteria bacterium]
MRVLVTGGAGFIGSHLTEEFRSRGDTVAIIDDFSSGKQEHVPAGTKIFECSVVDTAARKAIIEFAPEAVIHLAAQIDVRQSMEQPLHDTTVNVLGTVNVLTASAEAGVKHFIFASSGGTVYGDTEVIPTPEDHPNAPLSFYGAAKRSGEIYGMMVSAQHPMLFTALRYGNVYGPRQDPHGEAGVVAIFCSRLFQHEPLAIHGDGKQTRDYVYVTDVIAANCAVLENHAAGIFNIGTGIETSVNTLYEVIAKRCGGPPTAEHDAAKPGEQRRSCIDISRAQELLHWSPRVTLEEGIDATAAFFQMKHDLTRQPAQ